MLLIDIDDRELIDILSDTLQIITSTFGKSRRHTECCDHTSYSRMYSRVKHKVPKHEAEKHIESLPMTFENIGENHGRRT